MTIYLDGQKISAIKSAADSRFVPKSSVEKIRSMIKAEVEKVYGDYPQFEFPFSNESLTENKIVMTRIIKQRTN